MNCPKCNAFIPDKKNFCSHCGAKLENNNHENQYNYSTDYSNVTKSYDETHYEQFSYSQLYSNMLNQTITSDEDYIKSYIGPNYEKISGQSFSIPAFFLGPFYLLYRKLWLFAVIYIITFLLLISYTSDSSTLLVLVVTQLYLGLKFNSIYLNYTNKKIEEIKISNPDKSSTELLNICKKKGGVNPQLTIIIVIFIIIINTFIYEEDTNKTQKEENYLEEETYNIDTTMTMGKLTYKIPKGSKKSNYSNENYHYYNYQNENISCSINITKNDYINLYPTPEEYIKKHMTYNDPNPNINEVTFNNKKWTSYEKINQEYNYVTIYNDALYVIEINDYSYDDNNYTCKNISTDILSNTKFY